MIRGADFVVIEEGGVGMDTVAALAAGLQKREVARPHDLPGVMIEFYRAHL